MAKNIEKKKELTGNNVTLENAGRRKAVKTIIGGVTAVAAYNLLPARWNTPIIEQIFLPAHAATSGTSLHDPCTVTIVSGDQGTNSVVVRVNSYVTPPTADLPATIFATPVGAGAAVTVNTTTAADGTFTADITLSGGPGITRVDATTIVQGAEGTAGCGADVSVIAKSDPQEPVEPSEPVLSCSFGEYNSVTRRIPFTVSASSDNVDFAGAYIRMELVVTGTEIGGGDETYLYERSGRFPLGIDGTFIASANPFFPAHGSSFVGKWKLSWVLFFEDQLLYGTHSTSCEISWEIT